MILKINACRLTIAFSVDFLNRQGTNGQAASVIFKIARVHGSLERGVKPGLQQFGTQVRKCLQFE